MTTDNESNLRDRKTDRLSKKLCRARIIEIRLNL